MSAGKLQHLSQELRAPAPAAFQDLPDNQLQALSSALHVARRKQREQMARATEASLQHIPLLLRGAVKKMLGIS